MFQLPQSYQPESFASSLLRKRRKQFMDLIDLDYTHSADLSHTDPSRVAHELRHALVALGAEAPRLDEPITAMQHSLGSDGKLFVHVKLSDGLSRTYTFTPGQPVSIADQD